MVVIRRRFWVDHLGLVQVVGLEISRSVGHCTSTRWASQHVGGHCLMTAGHPAILLAYNVDLRMAIMRRCPILFRFVKSLTFGHLTLNKG